MVTCCVMAMTISCSTVTGHLFDTIIVQSTDKKIVVLMQQSVSDVKCWELLRATLIILCISFCLIHYLSDSFNSSQQGTKICDAICAQ